MIADTNEIAFGEVVDYEGTSPGPDPTYIVRVKTATSGVKTFRGVRPALWRWDALGVDEDAAKTVQGWRAAGSTEDRRTTVIGFRQGDAWLFHFIPAPLVGPCTGTDSEAIGMLLSRIVALEAKGAA